MKFLFYICHYVKIVLIILSNTMSENFEDLENKGCHHTDFEGFCVACTYYNSQCKHGNFGLCNFCDGDDNYDLYNSCDDEDGLCPHGQYSENCNHCFDNLFFDNLFSKENEDGCQHHDFKGLCDMCEYYKKQAAQDEQYDKLVNPNYSDLQCTHGNYGTCILCEDY